ncbi:TraB/VirB10 family protein [Marinobacter goseongensis]|uniref:TraB/VirB10 family protein n=1 Tax=Marinobacter goseongensis TaxID=453838 RepID=UPI0020044FCA|nr:TraB/VirB10 family protein [Marinobacter goseongensis]MCK7553389.1 hypothetical protein [Marinobacter goseongensis]
MSMKSFWADLDAKHKRMAMLGGGGALLVLILANFLFVDAPERKPEVQKSSVNLAGDNTDRLGVDALAARIRSMEASNETLDKQVRKLEETNAKLRTDLQNKVDGDTVARNYEQQMKILSDRLAAQTEQIQSLRRQQAQIAQNPATVQDQTFDSGAGGGIRGPMAGANGSIWDNRDLFQVPEDRRYAGARQGATAPRDQDSEEGETKPKGPMMRVIVDESKPVDEEPDADIETQFLPAGSIVSGRLITGIDAPTSTTSRDNPHPALLEISKEAILPNRFRADFKSCFLIIGGYGDMSSERAYLRSETVSCVNNDGRSVEQPIEAFAVGEDGKAGVRGRLVTKNGQLLARSVMAGFLSSASEVFSSSPVPTISTQASDTTPFQSALSSEAAQASALQGAGTAMERIADYYMSMAEQIFPILEVDAGRRIEMVITRGSEIAFVNE